MSKLFFSVSLFLTLVSFGQKTPENWYLLDPKEDKVYGGGVEQAYELLKGKKGKKVIVAVIDSGVDSEHEDLKDVMWTNENEIPNNGIDDDNNGYIDDIHGWSFLGGKTRDIDNETLEITRIYQKLSAKYSNTSSIDDVAKADKKEYEEFLEIEKKYTEDLTNNFNQFQNTAVLNMFIKAVKSKSDGKFEKSDIVAYQPQDKMEEQIKAICIKEKYYGNGFALDIVESEKYFMSALESSTMNSDSIRQVIVGDDPNDFENMYYGCNRIKGPDASHGTHVSGIIAANRLNNKGIMGIANNVEIMALRAVPNGDERDKDVAFAIRYAVDNGASIINMSFGKGYSQEKYLVDAAIKYAASKDVLLVQAAGNDSQNIDKVSNFPDRHFDDGTVATNHIVVGANAYKKGKRILADFSNYGKEDVDFFAPGVDIYSTYPDGQYESNSGTSMACPAVTGMAAIVRSYYPEMTAAEVRNLLMNTTEKYKKKLLSPEDYSKTKLTELCVTGGFVNVGNAIEFLQLK